MEIRVERKESKVMTTIRCPRCGRETSFELARDAIDDEGEIYRCRHCRWPFHYKYK